MFNRHKLLLIVVLLFPSLFYVILSTGSHNFISRPIYGPKTLSESSADTLYYTVKGLSFENCKKENIPIEQFKNQIILYHFITNKEPLKEKRKASQLIALHDRFKEKKDIKIVSIILDTNPNASCLFNKEYKLSNTQWTTVKALDSRQKIKSTFIVDLPTEIAQVDWENLFILVDKKGRIRAYRDAIQYVEERALIDDIKILKAEEFIPKKKEKDEAR